MIFTEDYFNFSETEARPEADSGLPQLCECGELFQDCDCTADPLPRFERINNGTCPDCDAELNDNGACVDCHIIPALDPEFQQWLRAKSGTQA